MKKKKMSPFDLLQNGMLSDNNDPQAGPNSFFKTNVNYEPMPILETVDGIRFDFANGVRLYAPPEIQGQYEVLMYDQVSGMLLDRVTLAPDQFYIGYRKYFVRWHLEIYKNGQPVFAYDYDCRGKKVYIIIPDGAIGDNLAWMPLAEEFRLKYGADVTCVCGEWMQTLCGDLYPGLDFVPLIRQPFLKDAYANYIGYIFDKQNCLQYHPVPHQLLGMQGAVQTSLGLDVKPVKCRLHLGSKRPFPERFVCISTYGKNISKNWNFPDGWNIIIRNLKKLGYRVLDIDREREVHFKDGEPPFQIPSEAEDFTGRFSIQERANLLEHADFFIGLPSGLAWLAWNANTPVVMLSGFTMPFTEFPTPYRVFNPFFCSACWNDTTNYPSPNYCPRFKGTPREVECTKAITPQMVWAAITKVPAFNDFIAGREGAEMLDWQQGQL